MNRVLDAAGTGRPQSTLSGCCNNARQQHHATAAPHGEAGKRRQAALILHELMLLMAAGNFHVWPTCLSSSLSLSKAALKRSM